jgi:hypothetical protein
VNQCHLTRLRIQSNYHIRTRKRELKILQRLWKLLTIQLFLILTCSNLLVSNSNTLRFLITLAQLQSNHHEHIWVAAVPAALLKTKMFGQAREIFRLKTQKIVPHSKIRRFLMRAISICFIRFGLGCFSVIYLFFQ